MILSQTETSILSDFLLTVASRPVATPSSICLTFSPRRSSQEKSRVTGKLDAIREDRQDTSR